MPKIRNQARFEVRYLGLQNEIKSLGLKTVFIETPKSYNQTTHVFDNPFTRTREPIDPAQNDLMVIRDLTMSRGSGFDMPVYSDPDAPPLVHNPDLSKYLLNKSSIAYDLPEIQPQTIIASAANIHGAAAEIAGQMIVVKPVTGMLSKNIFIGNKLDLPTRFKRGFYLVQGFIDTSQGIEELGIDGVHNLRMLSIDSCVIGAIGRVDSSMPYILLDDDYGEVYHPEDIPKSMLDIADKVHSTLRTKPGYGRSVITIDTMRGKNADGRVVDVLCEVNRRPLRICPYTLIKKQRRDPEGILWLAKEWDKREANLLVEIARS